MAESEIIQNQLARLGQSQDERLPRELGRHFAEVDERSGAALLAQARALATKLCFYQNDPETPSGDWSPFFPAGDDAALLARSDGEVPPHLALFATFLHLYRFPQQALNTITGRHLDFQFRRVLRFVPRPAQPDRAHLLLELKKGAAAIAMAPEHAFSAGKDARGVELIYRPLWETVINHGAVAALSAVYRDADHLHFAPIANSSDGLGGALDKAQPSWSPFGHAGMPSARIGFALAAPVLRLQEGERTLKIELHLAGLDPSRHTADALARSFEAYLTGPKGWIGPVPLAGSLEDDRLTLSGSIASTEPAVIDYDRAVHGHAFVAQAPVLQLLHGPGAALSTADLEGVALSCAQVTVEVAGLHALTLENDYGTLNPAKAFQPFGAQPVAGARLMIGCEEALSKRLLDLSVTLAWQGAPADLRSWYQAYGNGARMSGGVEATLNYQDRSGKPVNATMNLMARDAGGVTTLSPNAPPPAPQSYSADTRLYGLLASGTRIGYRLGRRTMLSHPIQQRATVPAPGVRTGFVTLTLLDDFLHADYRREVVENALKTNPIVLNEPYTPTVRTVSVGYRAQSDLVDFSANDVASFTNPDVQFFHVGCFGQRREHAFLREQLDYVDDKRVTLLPSYPHAGEFLIGLAGVAAGDSLSLLMQVAEGSADPELPAPVLRWSVLADNYWRPLTPQEVLRDGSNALRTSGIVGLALPSETSREHTFMPTGLVWLRATIAAHPDAVCQLIAVANNAIEVRFTGQEGDTAQRAGALAAGSIARLKTPLAQVKGVAQPYASFGGRPQESDEMLTRRAAERLRHRNRCLTPWDYERMLLEEFPEVHKVKCIPHASATSWLAPGHVMLVVVPDLRNRNAVDPLRPRVDSDTLARMTDFVQRHCGMQVSLTVKNPRYQRVRLEFKARFLPGRDYNFYRQQLNDALLRMLSPWAFDAQARIEFAGQVYRSVLLNFVEELPYVDFVSDFKMLSPDGSAPELDLALLRAETPDAILVSDRAHAIDEIKPA